MGILDEAIRQHLDLKRRQGADQDELQRLEDEAFGPPSRPGDPDFPQSEEQGEAATGEQELSEPADEAPSESAAAGPEAPSAETAQPATEESEQSAFFDAQVDSGSETEPGEDTDLDLELDADEAIGELEDEQPGTSGGDAPISSLDTVEHHFEEAMDEPEVVEDEESPPAESDANRPEDSAEEAEDVLEETPEFLQDTPEDDDLWFEQGEPKDFDF
jgi:hypothetical protein